ncbi:unnamed protein product [Brassica oleracea var. botrytis]|uniref:(rape) hypothetical protein n=1 Tax=Brassica napus TaxID=3708 RepID=A0A816ILA3_BRANA|nr:unnamed protein product [Brassica napus]
MCQENNEETTDRRREVQTAAPPETIVTPSDTSNLECHICRLKVLTKVKTDLDG